MEGDPPVTFLTSLPSPARHAPEQFRPQAVEHGDGGAGSALIRDLTFGARDADFVVTGERR